MSSELWGLSMVCHFRDLEVLSLEQIRDQVFDLLGWNHLRVNEEELEIDRGETILEHEEISICVKQL